MSGSTWLGRCLGAAVAVPWLAAVLFFGALPSAHAQPFNPDPTQKWKSPDWLPGGKAAIVTPELRDGRVYQLTPAQIIYYAAKENRINPVLLLVKIQAEQSLIKQSFDAATLEHKLNRVVGYGIPERDMFQEKWPGYYPQLVGMSYEFSTMAKKKDFHSAFIEYTPHEDKYVELVGIYKEYAAVLNQVAGKNYPVQPQSSGYLYDFRDINADHIQAFLDSYAGPLKNKQLFAGGGSTGNTMELPVLSYRTIPPTGNTSSFTTCDPQCVGFVKANSSLPGSYGDAKAYASNSLPGFSALERNGSKNKPKPGDILVWTETPKNTFGHVALVKSVDMAKRQLVRVAANETAPWCHINETTMAISGDASAGFTVASPAGWVFAGWRPRTSPVNLINVPYDPNWIDAQTQVTRSKFIDELVSRFPAIAGKDSLEKARTLGALTTGTLANPTGAITRLEVGLFLARTLETHKAALWSGTTPDVFADDFASPADRDTIGKLRRLGVFTGQYSQENNGLLFAPNRMTSTTEVATVLGRLVPIVGPLATPAVQSFAFSKSSIKAGETISVTLKTGALVRAAKLVFDVLPGGAAISLQNSAGNGLEWQLADRRIDAPGAAANQYQRPAWVVLTTLAGVELPAVPVAALTVAPAAAGDGMRYASDTPADDTLADGSARVAKAWTLANSGTTTWTTGYCLRPVSGTALATGAICPGGPVRPGESFVFSTTMTMPASQANQAMVKQNWALTNSAGVQVGPLVWAQFQVKALTGRNEPPTAINCPVPGTGWTWANSSPLHGPGKGVGGADDSHALDYNRNAPSFDADAGQPVYAVADGAVYQGNGWAGNSVGQILINHTEPDGTQWSTGYLHMRSKTTAATVRRGDQIGVVANVGVPDGNNHLHFAVYRGHNGVTSVARTPTCNVAAGADGMQFVNDTPADNVLVDGGARITKSWTLANSGSTTWTTAYCLRPVSGTALGSGMVCPTAPVAPGQRYTFNTTLVMPAAAATQTQVKQTWALSNAAGAQVGPAVWAQLQVRAAGGGGAFAIVEPFAMPASVRANADTWVGVLNLSKAASEVRMSLVDAQGRSSSPAWVQAAPTRWTLQHSFAQAGTYRWTLDVRDATGASVQRAGNVQVSELPPVPLNPVLTKAESVRALVPWSASLKTAAPVYQANLVFSNGRRIPLYGDQTAWETRNENCVFSEAGTFPYELHLQRSQTDPRIEVFAGGTLQVLPAIVPANPPTITSPNTAIQGQPYSLMVTTLVAADRVSVRWPDSGAEQGLQSSNPARTQWVYTSRLFMQAGAVTFTVRTYKDGLSMPTGEAMGMLQVTMPNAAIKLVGTSNNIVKGERPYFTVAASLAVERVTVQLGNQAAVALSALGPNGAEQSHRGQVLAAQAGNVPYTITGFNAQGQPVGTPITGQVAVADPSDGLTVPNPVPAEVPRGQAVSWQFRTKAGPAEMWLAVAAPIGNLPLTGYYLNTTFSQPAGDYGYQLMRRDHLGNVFPIQGASGTLRLRDAGALPAITGLRTQPAAGKVGQSLSFVATVSSPASIARVELVFPDAGNLLEPMAQQSADTWVRTRTMAQAGNNRPALVRLVLKDGRTVQGNLSYTVQP